MIFIDIDGKLEELRPLVAVDGLHLQRGMHELGGGRFRARGVAQNQAVVDAVRARGVTVTVTIDEAEARKRVAAERARIDAHDAQAARAKAQGPGEGGSRGQ